MYLSKKVFTSSYGFTEHFLIIMLAGFKSEFSKNSISKVNTNQLISNIATR